MLDSCRPGAPTPTWLKTFPCSTAAIVVAVTATTTITRTIPAAATVTTIVRAIPATSAPVVTATTVVTVITTATTVIAVSTTAATATAALGGSALEALTLRGKHHGAAFGAVPISWTRLFTATLASATVVSASAPATRRGSRAAPATPSAAAAYFHLHSTVLALTVVKLDAELHRVAIPYAALAIQKARYMAE